MDKLDIKRVQLMLSTRDSLRSKDTHMLKVKIWEKIFHENSKQKRRGVAVLLLLPTLWPLLCRE